MITCVCIQPQNLYRNNMSLDSSFEATITPFFSPRCLMHCGRCHGRQIRWTQGTQILPLTSTKSESLNSQVSFLAYETRTIRTSSQFFFRAVKQIFFHNTFSQQIFQTCNYSFFGLQTPVRDTNAVLLTMCTSTLSVNASDSTK